ncbi:hypothetical protein L6452_12412 [Arctium lappa]|uniref:Uncharacterized protein n=1 Tax=Arctium lappa TaxID=4217 RepID=A0ACB9DQV5_ARCLA|nr:hypothetical protein L6452_12412 [Arctium lappa]
MEEYRRSKANEGKQSFLALNIRKRQALLNFKHGIIDRANKLASWDGEDKECCSWAGIVCDNYTGHVHEIHLRGLDGQCKLLDFPSDQVLKQKLGGDLSPSLLHLKQLRHLDLSCNDFGGIQVPSFIGSLRNLRYLNLSISRFGGIIPPQLGNLSELQVLGLGSFYDPNYELTRNDFMNSSLVLKGLSNVGSNLISLGISSCGISSSVLATLHNLTSLFNLDLSDNQLTKAIPKSLGNLCNLRETDMSGNRFHNTSLTYLLESFFGCKSPSLESLVLQFSGLSGHLPDQLGRLIHLVHLNLEGNRIDGIIPDSIGQLSFMRSLQLKGNLVSGLVPYSIGGLSSLEMLDLSYNQLNGSISDSLGRLSKLNYLDLSSNLLTGVVTEAHFAKLTRLKYLLGSGNNLILRPQLANWTPPFPAAAVVFKLLGFRASISTLLTYLDISKNHIQGMLFSIPATLEMLDLSSNEFTGQLPYLSNGSGPTFLELSNNFFGGSLHHLLCPYDEKWTDILNLGNNNLSGVIPECWVKWPRLSHLILENNNMSGEVPRTLGFSSSLMSLNMHGNKLSGRLPASLMNLTNLWFLQLGRNELVGCIPTWLGTKLSSLMILELGSNNFDGNIPQELCHLANIQILDLAHNNLSGNIPRCFNNFSVLSGKATSSFLSYMFEPVGTKALVISESLVMKGREDIYNSILPLVMMIDLSSNNFVGHIPSELTALRQLKSLNLSRNQLTGRIPEKIGDMKSLESFDLSMNKLSGALPMSLSSLSFLSSFNVSFNSFTGRIPSSTQLQSLNESSFIGNNLCGDPLTKQCAVEVPAIDQEEEEDGDGADLGLIISMVLGLVTGFWMIVGPLVVIRSWRIAYFRFLTRVGYMVYDVMYKYCCYMFSK